MMEKQIQKIIHKLKIEYLLFWGVPLIIILIGECYFEWTGLYADEVRTVYLMETTGILLVACCVPLSLKLFSWVLNRKIDLVYLPKALNLYFRWSSVRILLLEIAVLANILIYYLTLSNTGLLCALISLTASLFCIPGEKRLRKELNIDQRND